jgi:hypothetical protein
MLRDGERFLGVEWKVLSLINQYTMVMARIWLSYYLLKLHTVY